MQLIVFHQDGHEDSTVRREDFVSFSSAKVSISIIVKLDYSQSLLSLIAMMD